MKTYELIFMDGTTQETQAETAEDALLVGMIVAKERKTYLLNIREKS